VFAAQETKTHIYLITEYCSGGDLAKAIRKRGALPEEEVRHLAVQLGK
jgi:serine/threonine protein kinase